MTVTLSLRGDRGYIRKHSYMLSSGVYDSTLMGSNRGEAGPPRGHAQLGHTPGSLPKGSGRSFSSH